MRPRPVLKPVPTALGFAAAYVVLCMIYIWLSGAAAAKVAGSVQELELYERIKGLAFVLITGVVFLLVCTAHLRRIAAQERTLIEQHRDLIAAERSAMAGIFAASTCHDANNVLAVVRGIIDLVRGGPGLPRRETELRGEAAQSCDRMTGLFRRLIGLAHHSLPGSAVSFDLPSLVADAVELAKGHESLRQHAISCAAPAHLAIEGNPQLISRALLNLVLNAGEAMKEPGTIRVELRTDGDAAVIEVHDSGPGIPDAEKGRIAGAFFSTKPGGTGLGLLSLVTCATEHAGRYEFLDSPLGGALVRLTLPAVPTRAEPLAAPA
ncbi:MAG: HAMP domain-containing sensor histidine kinase [Planctomycetota bacterium]